MPTNDAELRAKVYRLSQNNPNEHERESAKALYERLCKDAQVDPSKPPTEPFRGGARGGGKSQGYNPWGDIGLKDIYEYVKEQQRKAKQWRETSWGGPDFQEKEFQGEKYSYTYYDEPASPRDPYTWADPWASGTTKTATEVAVAAAEERLRATHSKDLDSLRDLHKRKLQKERERCANIVREATGPADAYERIMRGDGE